MGRIGKYEIVREIGRGATSTVYLARDPFAQRDVAIKLIAPEVLRDAVKGKLYRHLLANEASLVGKLVHPHIVQIYDACVDDDQGYVVMEYASGGTLEACCTPGQLLPLERIVEVVFKCSRALDYAYHQGITHRDVKPANILLAADCDIRISDFGAALTVTNDRTQISGIGSPAYMSPEQVREQSLNHQTDIYSLGVVLYQLLTGRLPFLATNNYQMVYHIIHSDPPRPSSLRHGVPPSLDAIVARAMHKRVEARYGSWNEFSHDLARAFRHQQLKARTAAVADSEKFETLRALPFFQAFSDVEIWEVVRFSRWQRIAAGSVLMKDGEAGRHFCFLAEGEVKVVKQGHVLSVLGRGECFGEMAVVGGDAPGVRVADVIATRDGLVVAIDVASLAGASEACRMHFYFAFLAVLAQRLAAANARLASV